MVLFQEFNVLAAAEFWFSTSHSRHAIGSSLTLQYNKFTGGKYKGRDSDDPQHFWGNDLTIQYYNVLRSFSTTIFLPSPQSPGSTHQGRRLTPGLRGWIMAFP
jgi:hypothetical protein